MIVKRRNGEVAKVLSAVNAILWLAALVYFVIRRILPHSAFMDFSGFFVSFSIAGFITAVATFVSVLSYYSRDAGYTGLQRAALICALISNILILQILPLFIGVFIGVSEIAIYIDLTIAAALFIASVVLLIISRIRTKKIGGQL